MQVSDSRNQSSACSSRRLIQLFLVEFYLLIQLIYLVLYAEYAAKYLNIFIFS